MRALTLALLGCSADVPPLHDLDAAWRPRAQPKARHAKAPKGARADLARDARVDAVTAASRQKERGNAKRTEPIVRRWGAPCRDLTAQLPFVRSYGCSCSRRATNTAASVRRSMPSLASSRDT